MVGYLMPTLGPYVLFDMVRAVLYPSSYTEFNEESGASSDSAPPPWVKENRGWTHEEAEAFKNDVARIGKSKVADRAETDRLAATDWLLDLNSQQQTQL